MPKKQWVVMVINTADEGALNPVDAIVSADNEKHADALSARISKAMPILRCVVTTLGNGEDYAAFTEEAASMSVPPDPAVKDSIVSSIKGLLNK